jgi:hypothetical protein
MREPTATEGVEKSIALTTETQRKGPFFSVLSASGARMANFIAWRGEKQILLPQGGIRMTCHSERSEESAFGCGYAALCLCGERFVS